MRSIKGQKAYSLVEILAVVLIIGVSAAVFIPNLFVTREYRLELAVNEVVQALRYARSEAIRVNDRKGVLPDSNALRIQVFSVDAGTNPWTLVFDIYDPLSKKIYDVKLNEVAEAQVDSMQLSASYSGNCNSQAIVFDTMGEPVCADPSGVRITNYQIDLNLDSYQRQISLNGASGRVVVQ